ncbi:SRPBCC family protein [Rufibacter immobilis]|uniref:SRPBCC family protein n=1 Tax=Rufibacter immobilis TaxID=1348778 RepID=UPI0035E77BE8
MPIITIKTTIQAPPGICFDLSRSIDLHQVSTAQTDEKAIKEVVAGLMELGESVRWEAKHLGIRQKLSSHITAYERSYFFADEMLTCTFKSYLHDRFVPLYLTLGFAGQTGRLHDIRHQLIWN